MASDGSWVARTTGKPLLPQCMALTHIADYLWQSLPRCALSATTTTSVSASIAIASCLALNARRSCLVCALHSSKDDPSTWDLDWHVSQ